MKHLFLYGAIAPLMFAAQAMAEPGDEVVVTQAATPQPSADTVTTGVARGRDRLDSATSTSTLRQAEIQQLAPRSIGELLRAVPGIRSEASTGEGGANISIRGLPIASTGAKFVQLQEDGLPILEFGDINFATADTFLRADLTLDQVQAIRGGSASTFASNSPGGIINFISRTGEAQGGAVQVTTGLDYDFNRVDFTYGDRISETLRFNVGGFYNHGEGPRSMGYDAERGGQIRANLTKDFDGGYIRLHAKYLNDRAPLYDLVPMRVTGTLANPTYSQIAGFDATSGNAISADFGNNITLDSNNDLLSRNLQDGWHPIVASVGFEAQFEALGWTVSNRFRYSDISAIMAGNLGSTSPIATAAEVATRLAGPGATLSYATGPNAGRAIANPAALNGNGLLWQPILRYMEFESLDNVINDLRLSRVFDIKGGELTTTAGLYNSRQTIDANWLWTSPILDVRGDGRSARVDIRNAAGQLVTQDGYFNFGTAQLGHLGRRLIRADYTVNAPFASLNYRLGRVALGASVRYDFGEAKGSRVGVELGQGRVGTTTRDMNGDGVISAPERRVSIYPTDRPAPIDYDYGYLSYSASVNVRISEPLAAFGRYSRGGRVYADRALISPYINPNTGNLTEGAEVDFVNQAEVGVKYRKDGLTLNLTGFWARSEDTNVNTLNGQPFQRDYAAKGLELEGGIRLGIFSLNGGATYTDAQIDKSPLAPALEGNVPRNQSDFIFQATPQITTGRLNLGAVFIGTTEAFASDTNQLTMPGYITTNAFLQYRLAERVSVSVNANNLFDEIALTAVEESVIPPSGVARTRTLTGRNVSASLRLDF